MIFTTFENKAQISEGFDEPIINMIRPGIKLRNGVNVIAIHYVTEYDVMRPDLIAEKYYQSTDGVDLILKMNGLYNPFAINEGQFLKIPDQDSAERFTQKLNRVSNKPRTQFTDPKKMTQQDKRRVEFLKEQAKKKTNASKQNLPPNILKEDEESITFKDGRIILGSNIENNGRGL